MVQRLFNHLVQKLTTSPSLVLLLCRPNLAKVGKRSPKSGITSRSKLLVLIVGGPAVKYACNYLLTVLVPRCLVRAVNLVCEAEDKSFIKRTGSAHGWDVLFYIFSFLKGISLFTLIVLIGTGWSFLKPYLLDNEKKVLMIVIPLQVVANIAQVAIDETGPFGQDWATWKQVFLLVDVICCCAVLFPIMWSIKNLREAAKTDGKAAVNLMKLTLFRHYYVVVICYIYFTRVVVYALETIASYRYLWTSVVSAELATLAFYAFTGYNFKPEAHNPYFALDDDEEEAVAEQLKLDDEFEMLYVRLVSRKQVMLPNPKNMTYTRLMWTWGTCF